MVPFAGLASTEHTSNESVYSLSESFHRRWASGSTSVGPSSSHCEFLFAVNELWLPLSDLPIAYPLSSSAVVDEWSLGAKLLHKECIVKNKSEFSDLSRIQNSRLSVWPPFAIVTSLMLALTLWLPNIAAAAENRQQTMIVLIDRSGSISELPNYQSVVVQHLLDLSRLTKGRLSLSFIFFGQDVEVVGADDGLPTPASEPLRKRCAEALAKPCAGGTPLPEALKAANSILAKLDTKTNKSIVLLSDGVPSIPLSPELFPEVKQALDDLLNEAAKSNDPNATEKILERIQDPKSEEAQKLASIQYPPLLKLTTEIAKSTSRFQARFVSIAFKSGMQDLRSIHQAAGGTESDYIETTPFDSVQALIEAKLVSGILQFPTLELPASDKFNLSQVAPVASELRADTLVSLQMQPTPQLEKLATFGFQVDSQRHLAGIEANETSELSLAHDSEGRIATISIVCNAAKQLSVGYISPKQELKFPGAKLYRLIELPEDLNLVCRPVSMEVETDLPLRLVAQRPEDLLVGMQWRSADGVALKGGEVVLKHTATGQQTLIPLTKDSRFANFLIAPAHQLLPGIYTVTANLTLRSGLTISSCLEKHLSVVGEAERVRLDVTKGSSAIDRIDFGPLGDAELQHDVSVTLASDTSFDLPLILRVVNIVDSQNNSIGDEWIRLQGTDKVILPAGKSMVATFRCSIPKEVAENIQDGLIQGVLEILNADTRQPVEIVPAAEKIATVESIRNVRFTLKRPRLQFSAPRAYRDLIGDESGKRTLRTTARITFPYSRDIRLQISSNSSIDRWVTLRVSRAQDAKGAVTEVAALRCGQDYTSEPVLVPVGQVAEIKLPFTVLDAHQRGYGSIVIAGEGIPSEVIHFDVGSGAENSLWLRWVAWSACLAAGIVLIPLSLKVKKLRPLCRSGKNPQGTRFPIGNVLNLFTFSAYGDQICFVPLQPNMSIQIGLDELRPMDAEEFMTTTDSVRLETTDGQAIAITGFSPQGSECWAKVINGGKYERELTWVARKKLLVQLSLLFAGTVGLLIRISPWTVEAVQTFCDFFYPF